VNRSAWVVFALAALLFAAGLIHLAGRELAAGSAYPEYSSLRADPDGSKLLFDALGRIPGLTVERNLLPLSLWRDKGAAILVLGVVPQSLDADKDATAQLLALAAAGNRVVLAFRFERALTGLRIAQLEKALGVRTGTAKGGPRTHPFFFQPSPGWTPLRTAGERILAMERASGSGSLVLAAESWWAMNDAVLDGRETALVSQAIGDCRRVVFDESHLGLAESGSVVGLARRFRLLGFAAGLAICALLFLWKNAPGFPPPAPVRGAARSGITARAGLVTLLRRHIAPRDLAAVCWRAWLETGRPGVAAGRLARAEEILREPSEPAGALRRIATVLQSKGVL